MTSASMIRPPAEPIDPRDPWEGVEAKSLSAPGFDQIKKKNPNIEIRWVNRACGKDTPTLRYEQMLSMGWVNATLNDVEAPPGCTKDGHIQIYDVILMKIDRNKYLGAMRFNNERVNRAVTRSGLASVNDDLRKEFQKEGVANKAKGKVTAFVPGQNER